MPLRIAFAGTPGFAVPPLEALARSAHAIVGVLTQPDRPAGRGRQLAMSPVKEFALQHGWPIDQPQTLRTPEGRALLASWQADVLVVVAYGLILPQGALDLPRLGCLNIHGSLLPRWRGAAPIQRAILAGDAETGVAIMRMDAGLDTGPVLLARRLPITDDATSAQLHDQLAALGAAALLEALDLIETGRATFSPQPEEGVTYAAKIEKAEARMDFRRSALELDRQVRAFNPWPIAETTFAGEVLRVHRARALAEDTGAVPGTVLGLGADGLRVAAGQGVLALQQLQRSGRKPVTAREFCNGLDLTGQVLG